MQEYKTFSLAVLALVGTLIGVLTGDFQPDIWETVMMVVVPSLAVRSIGGKLATTKKKD